MRTFISKIILFTIPILLYCLFFVAPFYYAGYITHEFMDAEDCIELQRSNPTSIYGLGYSGQTPYYKLTNANYYKAPIISLGTSRVMQFKHEYFSSSFYNCGGAVGGNYDEYINFLKNLDYNPDVIILGLDSWVFNDNWNKGCDDYSSFIKISKPTIDTWALSANIRKDWNKKWTFNQLNTYNNNIGFNGRIKDNGFMSDGSYYYGNVYRSPETQNDYEFKNTLDRIATGTARFEWGDHIDEETMVLLEDLLKYCSQKQIYVIGVLTPFAPRIYSTMQSSSNYGYMNEISPACSALFKKYNYEFYDYLNVSGLSISDEQFIDGFHGGDIVYGYIVKDMCSNGSSLRQFVNEEALNNLLTNAYDGLTFYDPDDRPN